MKFAALREPVVLTVLGWLLLFGAVLSGFHGVASVARYGASSPKGADVYYDAVHGARHSWARDNQRYRYGYHTVSGFNRFIHAMGEQGYDVHVERSDGFTRASLEPYEVFFVGEQTYHSRFMTEDEQQALRDWVHDGGGLFAVVEHTNAHYMAEVFNALFEGMPVQARYDSIGDMAQPRPLSPTWLPLTEIREHPVTEGVRDYRFYNGGSLDTEHGVLLSSPSSWSDEHNEHARPVQNGNKIRDAGEASGPLAGVAAFEWGAGRVVVIADHNALSNPTLYWGDHHRFMTNALAWLAGERLNADLGWLVLGLLLGAGGGLLVARQRPVRPHGPALAVGLALLVGALPGALAPPSYDLLLYTGHDSSMRFNTKSAQGYFSLYGQLTKEPQLRPWARSELAPGYDALLLAAPTRAFTDDEIDVLRSYLRRGRRVVYMASIPSLRSPAGEQLMSEFGFSVTFDEELPLKGRRPWNFHGEAPFDADLYRTYVYPGSVGLTVEGLRPIAWITKGGFHASERQWRHHRHRFDVVSTTAVGRGEFVLFGPVELYNDHTLFNLYEPADVVREQMRETVLRVGKYAVGDDSPMPVD